MEFLNILKDKIDSTKDYLVNKFVENNDEPEQQYEVKGREKEITYNFKETKKVEYIKQASSYKLNLEINGISIFQNLILTAKAIQNNEPVPIKCNWKRIYEETIITIQDINSYSYMPNAEDIGYQIEVEVSSLDDPEDIAIAQYGPIVIDKDMENAIELFLTSGKNFNLYLFDQNTQEKMKDKEYILYLKNDEIILSNYDVKGKESILEKCVYSQLNPIIKLSPTNVNKITFTFIEYDSNSNKLGYESNNNFNNNNEEIKYKKKNEYEFITMSKQNRELIYLLIQFFVIDEKLKNNKLFTLINNDSIPTEEKLGITDLVGELNELKKENIKTLNNMNKLNERNKNLNENYKDLEEDFSVTLSQINEKNSYIQEEIYRANKKSNINYTKDINNSYKKSSEWKKKYDSLFNSYSLLLSKQKELELNKAMLLNKENESKNKLKNNNDDLNLIKEKNNNLKNEIKATNERLVKAKEDYNNIKNRYENYKMQLSQLKEENNNLNKKNKENNDMNKNKDEIIKIRKNNEDLNEENKNLLSERDLLNKAKNELCKELENNKKEKDELQMQYNDLKENINNNSSSSSNNIELIDELKMKNLNLKNKYEKLKEEYNALVLEQNNLQELYDKSLKNNNNSLNMSQSIISNIYQLSQEEYEEYDILRKNKDENEALILQLKSNNQAKELEKQELKAILRDLEKD